MKLAIVIEGEQNSGKTSTIKEFINIYTERKLVQMRRGWQSLYLNLNFKSLHLYCYCLPSSPSERGEKIGITFNGFSPEILILAEQPSGQNYIDTMNYLKLKNYKIVSYSLSNKQGLLNWDRFDSKSQVIKLENRANEIMKSIRYHINSNRLI